MVLTNGILLMRKWYKVLLIGNNYYLSILKCILSKSIKNIKNEGKALKCYSYI